MRRPTSRDRIQEHLDEPVVDRAHVVVGQTAELAGLPTTVGRVNELDPPPSPVSAVEAGEKRLLHEPVAEQQLDRLRPVFGERNHSPRIDSAGVGLLPRQRPHLLQRPDNPAITQGPLQGHTTEHCKHRAQQIQQRHGGTMPAAHHDRQTHTADDPRCMDLAPPAASSATSGAAHPSDLVLQVASAAYLGRYRARIHTESVVGSSCAGVPPWSSTRSPRGHRTVRALAAGRRCYQPQRSPGGYRSWSTSTGSA